VSVPPPADPVALSAWIDAVFEAHPHEVARLRAGEQRLMDFFVGRVLVISGGRADPVDTRRMIAERSSAGWEEPGGGAPP
jgi:Asp-tRNA(Asn)/Glu-tRNA(Gln) amidotransferase B subunit